jgi:hypothetical protein
MKNSVFKHKISALILSIAVMAGSFYGCNDSSTNTTRPDNLSFGYMSTADTTDNAGNLVLDTVKILLKDIKLNVANSSDSTNFKTGPYVLYLNLNSSVNIIGSAYIPAGTYDKIQFEVHKLNDNETPPDPEFSDANGRYSVIAKGTYNGTYFKFKSDKSAKQKLNFPNALTVSENGNSNITLKVHPYSWFIDGNNGFMDPNAAGNQDKIDKNIKENIKANFKAFKDDDKNGIPD